MRRAAAFLFAWSALVQVACGNPPDVGDVPPSDALAFDAIDATLSLDAEDHGSNDAPAIDSSSDSNDVPRADTVADTPTASWWRPTPGTSWQWQLSGTIDTTIDVRMYDIDLFEAPQSVIDALHVAGRIVVCYVNAGAQEDWRPDASQYPAAALGNALAGWPGERWIDTRDVTVRNILRARLDLAVTKHCDGVEPDNVDGYANNPGFPLTATDQLDFNRFLAREAHARGLSVGLKNDLDQVADLVGDFDWALNEQCFQYSECDLLTPFITTGRAVFNVEYGDASLATSVCPMANARDFDTLVKHVDLGVFRIGCR